MFIALLLGVAIYGVTMFGSLAPWVVQHPFPGKWALHNAGSKAAEHAESARCVLYTLDPPYR